MSAIAPAQCCYFCVPGGPVQCVLCVLNPISCVVCFMPHANSQKASAEKITGILQKYGLKCTSIKDEDASSSEIVTFQSAQP